MSSKNGYISDQIYNYILENSLREDEILTELRERTQALPNAGMQISAHQGQFMSLLTKLIGAKNTLEVGVFTGYSSLVVARALPADGKITACDVSEEYTSIAREFWKKAGVSDKIDLNIGPASETLDKLLSNGRQGQYDMAFIDADKENYTDYYEKSLALLRPNGLILVDNVLWGGRTADPSHTEETTVIIRELNKKIKDDDRVDVSLIPVGDGLTLARKR